MVAHTDAIIDPRAMMVESFNASVAHSAVLATTRAYSEAVGA